MDGHFKLRGTLWGLCVLVLCVLLTGEARAWIQPFRGMSYVRHLVPTSDGAEIVVIEITGLKGQVREKPTKGVVALHPGYFETAEAFNEYIERYVRRGWRVFAMHAREVGIGHLRSRPSRQSSHRGVLSQVLVNDTQAFWDFLIKIVPGERFHVVGHSMGGGKILASLSDPTRGQYFQEHVASATLIAGLIPQMDKMPTLLRNVALQLRPLLRAALRKELRYIAPHHPIVEWARQWSVRNGLAQKVLLSGAQGVARVLSLALYGIIVQPELTSLSELSNVIYTSAGFSLGLALGWCEAIIEGRLPVSVDPSRVHVPTMVVAAEKDRLFPLEEERKLYNVFEGDPSQPFHKWVALKNAHHVDPVTSSLVVESLFHEILQFQLSPEQSTKIGPIELEPCEWALSA